MRISDCSSDVCSSDLTCVMKAFGIGSAHEVAHVGNGVVGNDGDGLDSIDGPQVSGHASKAVQNLGLGGKAVAVFQAFQLACLDFIQQIGRASCRERVCQYV